MKFAATDTSDGHLIRGYEPGRIFIAGQVYTNALIVSPERIITSWGPVCAADLKSEHFDALVDLNPQVIIVGTGERQVFPDPRLYVPALRRGMGLEVMDTGAACRTYNILMAEGRKVVAGLVLR